MHTDLVHQIFTHGETVLGVSCDVTGSSTLPQWTSKLKSSPVQVESACLRARQYLKEPNS